LATQSIRAGGRTIHRRSRRWRRNTLVAYGFISLNIVGLVVFWAGPVLTSLGLSFARWDLISSVEFAGLQNYIELLFRDDLFGRALLNTAYYVVLAVPAILLVALLLALALNQPLSGVKVYRTIYFIPVVCSNVAVSVIWKWLYNTEFGLLNYFLGIVGLGPVNWLGNTAIALPAVVLLNTWKFAGYDMVILLAGLQGIPAHLYDAAKVDGANRWQAFWRITLPLLTPSIFFVVVLGIIGSFQVFDQVYLMTQGGPGNATLVYNYYLYQNAFLYLKMGIASAMAYILFAIVFVVTLVQVRFLGRRVVYELG
jgi:multiple sugar transport system permease protein